MSVFTGVAAGIFLCRKGSLTEGFTGSRLQRLGPGPLFPCMPSCACSRRRTHLHLPSIERIDDCKRWGDGCEGCDASAYGGASADAKLQATGSADHDQKSEQSAQHFIAAPRRNLGAGLTKSECFGLREEAEDSGTKASRTYIKCFEQVSTKDGHMQTGLTGRKC